MTHTPGPWEIECESGNPHEAFTISKLGPSERTVGWSANSYDPETDQEYISVEDRANARLIAAAPALLEALEAMLSCCTDDHCEDAIKAEQAIALAKGEEVTA